MDAKREIEAEVCVVGGGPAGSTIAARLAALGHEVCLIEQSAFPRPHVGESLPPSILPLLEILSLRERIEAARFIRPKGVRMRWSGPQEFIAAPQAPGFLVDRARFDELLLEAARDAGVRILQPARAAPPARDAGGNWRIRARGAMDYLVRARFLVSAVGRSPFTPSRKKRISAPTLALYGYWRGADCQTDEMLVEAGPEEWFWGGPLPNGLFNATVFLSPERCRRAARRNSIEELYRALLSSSRLLRNCLRATLASPVRLVSASSYYNESCITSSSIKVGEASFAIDPLSSQGIQAAVQSALQGAVVAHTLLTSRANARAAIEYYRARQEEMSAAYALNASNFYAQQRLFSDSPFWTERSQAQHQPSGQPVKYGNAGELPCNRRLHLSQSVRLCETPAIDKEIVRYMPAMIHSSLERPVAFLGGMEMGALASLLTERLTAEEIAQRCSSHLPYLKCRGVLQWMWDRGILVSEV